MMVQLKSVLLSHTTDENAAGKIAKVEGGDDRPRCGLGGEHARKAASHVSHFDGPGSGRLYSCHRGAERRSIRASTSG
jgi:hypothetical protein